MVFWNNEVSEVYPGSKLSAELSVVAATSGLLPATRRR
jgi:hypothetical protein